VGVVESQWKLRSGGDQTTKKKFKTYGVPELPPSEELDGEATFLDAETNKVEV